MRIITDYTIEELKGIDARTVIRRLADDPAKQKFCKYLRLCRQYESDVSQLRFIAGSIPARKPKNKFDQAEMRKIADEHQEQVNKATEARKKQLDRDLKYIADLEAELLKGTPDMEVWGLTEVVLKGTSPEEVEPSNDVFKEAREVIEAVEQMMDSLPKEERTDMTKRIKTPLKNAIKQNNEKLVSLKLEELKKFLKD